MPVELFNRFRDERNPAGAARGVVDKARFARAMCDAGVPAVRELFTVTRGRQILDREGRPVPFRGFVARLHASRHDAFFVKPMASGQGRGAFRMDLAGDAVADGDDKYEGDAFLDRLFADRPHKNYVVQPFIRQHALLDEINSASVNTVRIDTFVDDRDDVRLSTAVLRMSDGTQVMDNFSTGGFIVDVDVASGRLGTDARTKPTTGRVVRAHPTSGFVFADTVLPHWDELIDAVLHGARALRPLGCIGWDVAIGPGGPVVVEANHTYDGSTQQEGARGLRDSPIGRAIRRRFGLR
jgi:hypothetical protein